MTASFAAHDRGVPMAVQAKNALIFYFDAYYQGVRRSFYYELNDEIADPKETTIEAHFGLFQADGTAKTAAVALHNLTTILADPSPIASPGKLGLTVSANKGVTIYHMLMQRGDGVYILALWQDTPIWNTSTLQTINVVSQQTLINFGITAKVVQVYDPMVGVAPIYNNVNLAGLTQMVPDHPIFVFLKP